MRIFISSFFVFLFFSLAIEANDRFNLNDIHQKPYNIEKFMQDEKPVVLVFWQTWCATCKREAPALAEAARTYGEDFHFFGIVSGTDEFVDDKKVRRFATDQALPYPQLRDRTLVLTKSFKVKGTPTIIIVGKNQDILYQGHQLPADWKTFIPSTK